MASSASVSGCLSSVSATSLQSRPFYVQGMENDPEDIFDVVSVGPPFQYVIPSFDVLAVELRQMRIVGRHQVTGEEKNYDLFVRNEASLCRSYPARMTVKDLLVIQVYKRVCMELVLLIQRFFLHVTVSAPPGIVQYRLLIMHINNSLVNN